MRQERGRGSRLDPAEKVGLVAQPLTGAALTVLTVLTVLGEGGSDGVTSDEAGL